MPQPLNTAPPGGRNLQDRVSGKLPLWRILLAACTITLAGITDAHAFGFHDVIQQAKHLAATPYVAPDTPALPKALAKLDHNKYQEIHFKARDELWAGSRLKFRVGFMVRGGTYRGKIRLNEVDRTGVHPIPFRPNAFDLKAVGLTPKQIRGVGFSGFRIRFPINPGKPRSMVLEFHGASYFQALGENQVAGVTARGLAVDTALPSGEKFPRFVEFWIERPAIGDGAMVIDALMNSRSATGAYRFALRPGINTTVQVSAHLFLRRNIAKLGLAPLGSMYLYGANDPNRTRDDFRPQVHSSDGLQIEAGTGEWLWRPLINPKRLLITSFALTNPQGFGLMQRDRNFAHYEDLRHRYDLAPSVWVRPLGKWGYGHVELVEIPSPDATNSNIVTFWVPGHAPTPGHPYSFDYEIDWELIHPTYPPNAWVTQTRKGYDSATTAQGGIGFVVDFNGPALRKLPPDAPVKAIVSCNNNGKILLNRVRYNSVTGGRRLYLRLQRHNATKPVELRAYLRTGHNTISETWSYILPPS